MKSGPSSCPATVKTSGGATAAGPPVRQAGPRRPAQAVAAQFGQMPRYVTSTPETMKP
jgi:hypothetical protein